MRLTAEGKAAVDATMADLLDAERTLLLPLDPAEQDRLAGQLRSAAAALPRFSSDHLPRLSGEFGRDYPVKFTGLTVSSAVVSR